MEGVFAEVEKLPHVSEVASPYAGGGAAAVSDDGKIAYATVQFDVANNKLDKDKTRKIIAIAAGRGGPAASRSSSAASRSRKRAQEEAATPPS